MFNDAYAFTLTIDILFLVDLISNFTVALQDDDFNIIDDRKVICYQYLKGWFVIDLVAILPLDQILSSDVNQFVRIARVGKLWKLIKITRLLRLIKAFHYQEKLITKLKNTFNLGRGLEKFAFFILLFFLICHLMSCLWIFTADISTTDDAEINWITKNGF